jgi:hypothetical protein
MWKILHVHFQEIKAGAFIGPQIRQLFKDQPFEAVLSDNEKAAWPSFKKILKMVFWEISKLQISENLYKIWWIRMNSWGAICQ